jgi:Transcription factor AFT
MSNDVDVDAMMMTDSSSEEDDKDMDYMEEDDDNGEDVVEDDEDEKDRAIESFAYFKGKIFNNRKDMEISIREYYKNKGLLLKIGKHSDKQRLTMLCLAGSKFKAKGNGIRDSTTRLNNCPFQVLGRYCLATDDWRVKKINETHNHVLSQAYVEYRKFTEEDVNFIRSCAILGLTPTAILLQFQAKFGKTCNTIRDIQNEIQRFRMEYLAGRTPIMALRDSLNEENFMFNIDLCPVTNKVRSLFLLLTKLFC